MTWRVACTKFDSFPFVVFVVRVFVAGGRLSLCRCCCCLMLYCRRCRYPFTKGARFYAVGNLALLDAPNEYHVNATTGS